MDNKKLNVCLINDSFPPLIDGVANTVKNYGHIINNTLGEATVVTPYYPDADDEEFDFPVYRFPSINTTGLVGYRAGIPFSIETIGALKRKEFDIIHSHCPATSSVLGRVLRDEIDKPLIFTYHTKFDIDIHNSIKGRHIQEGAVRLIVDNVSASDEVWVVSDGAGKNIQSLGYEGDYVVMPNGVDIPKGRLSEALTREVVAEYNLPEDVPLYLFVGRIMWYKGIKIILDALKKLAEDGYEFCMVFIGGGADKKEIREYTKKLGLGKRVIFVNPISSRFLLRAWYSRADLFLFPSTFDTNGLVVREAAACGLASVLVRGSCAAEDTSDFVNSFWIDENAESLYSLLKHLYGQNTKIREVGDNAQSQLYMSWDDAVNKAYDRYGIVYDRYMSSGREKRRKLSDQLLEASADVIDDILKIQESRRSIFRDPDRYK